ncbi:hypothetical protein FA15DRAFT_673579 [Coprinopsis marcescibilis]|uniref:Uncharacterized protein n=1 Tax=Coprinopsis marcescibilis TaxID=230819 RepID=A0A5C3KJE3_COPMA|nr:hypothetical protein FA15DRAFT_673579 [Coprinopsis marcescibilis]
MTSRNDLAALPQDLRTVRSSPGVGFEGSLISLLLPNADSVILVAHHRRQAGSDAAHFRSVDRDIGEEPAHSGTTGTPLKEALVDCVSGPSLAPSRISRAADDSGEKAVKRGRNWLSCTGGSGDGYCRVRICWIIVESTANLMKQTVLTYSSQEQSLW